MLTLIIHGFIYLFIAICLLSSVVNCTDPGIPANSIRKSKIEYGNFTFGTVVSYDCNPGYYLFGSSVLTCQPVGYWDKPLPECLGTSVWDLSQHFISHYFDSLSLTIFELFPSERPRENVTG